MFRLAKELGMTVQELGSRMSSSELVEWAAFLTLQDDYVQDGVPVDEKQAKAAFQHYKKLWEGGGGNA